MDCDTNTVVFTVEMYYYVPNVNYKLAQARVKRLVIHQIDIDNNIRVSYVVKKEAFNYVELISIFLYACMNTEWIAEGALLVILDISNCSEIYFVNAYWVMFSRLHHDFK